MTEPTKLSWDEIKALATPEGTPLPWGGVVYSIDPIELADRSPDGILKYATPDTCSDPERMAKYNEQVRQWRIKLGQEP